jgi:ABC-type dipeptide/oligopeptide/nickel transport system permease subunit
VTHVPASYRTSVEHPTLFNRQSGQFRLFLKAYTSRRINTISVIIIVIIVLCAILAPLIAPYDPYKQSLRDSLNDPSSSHLLGTDLHGRDVFSRILFGARTSLMVGVFSVCIGSILGTLLGLIAGYYEGLIGSLIMRFTDALMTIPTIMLALAIGSARGGGLSNVTIAIGIAFLPTYIRLMRGQVLVTKQADYILSSHALGAKELYIVFRHILPNTLSPIIVLITMNFGAAILAEAGLSFLGLGIDPPGAAWGSMVNDGYPYLLSHPILSFAPGVCIITLVLAINMAGDGLRDTLDPTLRRLI